MPRPKQKPPNPISAAIQEWFNHSREELTTLTPPAALDTLLAQAPKRWVTYEPMVLLPSGSFTSPAWRATLTAASPESSDVLWRTILRNVGTKSSEKATHLAVNDGIPLLTVADKPDADADAAAANNILRSPFGLRMLHGDFGPSSTPYGRPSQADFEQAFWVSTKQNGIVQTCAPRWTMFSRGNVKEKTRLLGFHNHQSGLPPTKAVTDANTPSSSSLLAHRAALPPPGSCAVDLYGGIGYFVFSYAELGMRVLCWELNPWSVEGLRRGARANGWSVRVVEGEEELRRLTREVVGEGDGIVVFLEDNAEAARRVRELRAGGDHDAGWASPVVHVNCGLLPRSDDSWEAAREILGGDGGGWLHLHENVGVKDIESRSTEIQGLFDGWDQRDGGHRAAKVEHVELVKTFAPDVWHCVFDVYITTSRSNIAPQ